MRGAHRRAPHRGWEEDGEVDAIEKCGTEMRSIFESWRRKNPSGDYMQDLSVVEQKLKMLELFVSSERQAWTGKYATKCQQHAALQLQLSACKQSNNKTMTQAFEDVTVMTERIKKTEESYLKCKIDKEHLEFEFQKEIVAMSRKLSEMEHSVYSARVESEKASREVKAQHQLVRQLEASSAAKDAEKEQLSLKATRLEEEIVARKTREVQLLQDVERLKQVMEQETLQAKLQMNESLTAKQKFDSRMSQLQSELQESKQEIAYLSSLKATNEALVSKNASLEVELKEAIDERNKEVNQLKLAADFEISSLKSSKQQEVQMQQEEIDSLKSQHSRMEQQAKSETLSLKSELEEYRNMVEQTRRADLLKVELSTAEKNESESNLVELRSRVQELTLELSKSRREADLSLDEANGKVAALTQEIAYLSYLKTHIHSYDQTYSKVIQSLSNKLDRVDECLMAVDAMRARAAEQTQLEQSSPPPAPAPPPSVPVSPRRDAAEAESARLIHNLKRWLNRERGLRKAMEEKVKDIRAERDFSKRLLKDFLLQSTRAKAEALASLSFLKLGDDAGGVELDPRRKREMLSKQVEKLKEMKMIAEGMSGGDESLTRSKEFTSGHVLFSKFHKDVMEVKSETPNSMSDFLLFGHDGGQEATKKHVRAVNKGGRTEYLDDGGDGGGGRISDEDEGSLRSYLSGFLNGLMEEVVAQSIIGSETDSEVSFSPEEADERGGPRVDNLQELQS